MATSAAKQVIVAIVGSRGYPDWSDVRAFVESLKPTTKVISGGARGVDKWATVCARARGLDADDYPADWDGLGKSAGFHRNTKLVALAHHVVAFWDGRSPGTIDTIVKALDLGRLFRVYVREDGELTSYNAKAFSTTFTQQVVSARARLRKRGAR